MRSDNRHSLLSQAAVPVGARSLHSDESGTALALVVIIAPMKGNTDTMEDIERLGDRYRKLLKEAPASPEWIRTLPSDLLELHPLVKELRYALQTKDASLVNKDREIARLHVAIAFGLKQIPLPLDHPDKA
jgi:hypothetical protein